VTIFSDQLFKVTEVKVHLGQVANNPPTSIQSMSAELGPLVSIFFQFSLLLYTCHPRCRHLDVQGLSHRQPLGGSAT
jgi:hypothetical protein